MKVGETARSSFPPFPAHSVSNSASEQYSDKGSGWITDLRDTGGRWVRGPLSCYNMSLSMILVVHIISTNRIPI